MAADKLRIGIKFSPPDNRIGGSQHTYTQHLIPALTRVHEPVVLFTASPGLFQEIDGIDVRGAENPYSKPGIINKALSFVEQQALFGRVVRTRCDVLFSPFTSEALRFDWGVPQVIMVHDVIPLLFRSDFKATNRLWKYNLIPILRRARAIITVSENTKNDVVRLCRIDPSRIWTAYNGFADVEGRRVQVDGEPNQYILYVCSTHYPYKNIERLLHAYNRVKQSVPHKLIIVGKRTKRFSGIIKKTIAKLQLSDRLVLEEDVSVDKLNMLYTGASLFVYPSLYEGFGMPPLEAMAHGIPVVAARAASIPEVCGDAAYYVDPEDIESIAIGISTVLSNRSLREHLRLRGLKRVKGFCWTRMAETIIEVCKKVA